MTTCARTGVDATVIGEDDGSVYRMTLSDVTDPESADDHIWYCFAYRSSNKAENLDIDLYQGTTQINTTTSCGGSIGHGTPATMFPAPVGTCTLTSGEANAITDYTDLRIRVTATGTNPTDVFVDSCNMEVPNAPAGGEEMMVIGR